MMLAGEDLDALSEIVNIGVGRAAMSLSDLLGERIDLQVPVVRMVSLAEATERGETGISILQEFSGEVSGNALLVFPKQHGCSLACLLAGYDEGEDIPPLELSGILSEVGNIVLNGVLGSLGNIMESPLDYQVPDFYVDESLSSLVLRGEECGENERHLVIADTEFQVATKNISGTVLIAFKIGALENLLQFVRALQS